MDQTIGVSEKLRETPRGWRGQGRREAAGLVVVVNQKSPKRVCAACGLPWMDVGEEQPNELLPPASSLLKLLCSEAVEKVGEPLL